MTTIPKAGSRPISRGRVADSSRPSSNSRSRPISTSRSSFLERSTIDTSRSLSRSKRNTSTVHSHSTQNSQPRSYVPIPSAMVSIPDLTTPQYSSRSLSRDDLLLSQTIKPSHNSSPPSTKSSLCVCGCDCCSDGYVKALQELIADHEQREREMTLKVKEMQNTREEVMIQIGKYRERVEATVEQLEMKNLQISEENAQLQDKVKQLENNLKVIKSMLS
ncbi:hypothetical protein RCL1_001701 [Eukaryota sp. TZLM3-RCL]